jgi:hypothetical protein
MQTPIPQPSVPAVAGGFLALIGLALWRLGLEFERAWMRSYDWCALESELGDAPTYSS